MEEDLKQRVRDRYAGAARSVLGEAEDGGSCCGDGASCCGVAESGERAAFEVDMVCGATPRLRGVSYHSLRPMLHWGVVIRWRLRRSRPVRLCSTSAAAVG